MKKGLFCLVIIHNFTTDDDFNYFWRFSIPLLYEDSSKISEEAMDMAIKTYNDFLNGANSKEDIEWIYSDFGFGRIIVRNKVTKWYVDYTLSFSTIS